MVAPPSTGLQQALQAVVQSVHWTYSLFWQVCPQQGTLVWGDGYYNGGIKTRKTVQPVEVSTEEASLQRSQQLRELFESLSSGEANLPARRPCAALSPEDLTEAEWFYLMCISFSFPPGVGLPGKAFARQRHVWLTRANEVDSKAFSRAILAKSAHVQTVVCIPLMDGVLELGNIEKVEEDMALIQHAKRFFTDYFDVHTKPALSEQSASNQFASADHALYHQQAPIIHQMNMETHASNQEEDDAHDHNEDYNDDDDDDGDDDGDGSCRSELKGMRYGVDVSMHHPAVAAAAAAAEEEEASELMQLEMSEDIRVGSVSDCSNNLDVEHMPDGESKKQRQDHDFSKNWHFLLEDLGNGFGFQQSLGTQVQDFSSEDAHYSETVSSILRHNMNRWVDASSFSYLVRSHNSAFSMWSCKRDHTVSSQGSSQWLLKSVLLNIGDRLCKLGDGRDGEGGNKLQKCATQEEVSANHVLAERRRREKLNERFMVLRSLVPFVTKMDKASILGDTIEYIEQLRRRIQDLEGRNRQQSSKRQCGSQVGNCKLDVQRRVGLSADKRKLQVLEGSNGMATTSVHVSMAEVDALLELHCPCRDGLLLDIMQTLHELGLEVSSLQCSSTNGVFGAEMRSKMKEAYGRRVDIVELKKAIHQIISDH
ncbi:transcription factor BHLH42 isoform X1 [Musa acuminata AAA Group]|uniref:transcription factor BHLH42 isoform X1 n=1 Tax=Musa acuminata AAA Group TaxID=214697 RepID=UPI0031DD7617